MDRSICFGVAPSMVVYFWSLQSAGGIGWAVTLFFIVCCGLRLARFNSMLGKLPPYAYNYFTGVPAPAGAFMSLLPIVIDLAFGIGIVAEPIVAGAWSAIMACLMVSRVPTYSFKRFKVPQPYILPLFVVVGLMVAGLAGRPWVVLTVVAAMYLMTFPFSIRSFHRLKAEAERLHDDSDENGSSTDALDQDESSDDGPPNLRSV